MARNVPFDKAQLTLVCLAARAGLADVSPKRLIAARCRREGKRVNERCSGVERVRDRA